MGGWVGGWMGVWMGGRVCNNLISWVVKLDVWGSMDGDGHMGLGWVGVGVGDG